MNKYLLIKYLLGLLVIFSLTFPSIAGCPIKVSEEQFDEISQSVTEEHLPQAVRRCNKSCSYHSEASVYLMRHGGTAPVEGFEFFPKQIAEVGQGRSDIETAISYLSTSDEEAIKINGVTVSRADLLAEKNEGIDFLDDKQRDIYYDAINRKLKIPGALNINRGISVATFDQGGVSFAPFRYAKKVINVLNEIEDNKPFFISVSWKTFSGKRLSHSMPAMRYVEKGTGIKRVVLGFPGLHWQDVIYNDLSSFKSALKNVMSSYTNGELKSIKEISIMEPL